MALYNFTDTKKAPDRKLSGEAFTINGERLESIVQGFRTLYVKGREAMTANVETVDAGRAHGSKFAYKKYPERIITVGFQVLANNNDEFRQAFNQLADALNVEQAQFIFDDEPDKYFIGTPAEISEIEAGRNKVTGEFSIVCADPLKYAVQEKVVTTKNTDIYYDGTVPADYIIEGKAAANANIRWLAFGMNDNSIVLGDIEAANDTTKYAKLEQDLNVGTLSVTTYETMFEIPDAGTFQHDSYISWRYIVHLDSDNVTKSSAFNIRVQVKGSPVATTGRPTPATIRIIKDAAGLRVVVALKSRVIGEYYFDPDDFFPACISVFCNNDYIVYRINDIYLRTNTDVPWAYGCMVEVNSISACTLKSDMIRFFGDRIDGEAVNSYLTAPNKLVTGDTIKIDTAKRAVFVDGVPRPDLNYLTNFWNIQLQQGDNVSYINGAGGSITDYKLTYREQWL